MVSPGSVNGVASEEAAGTAPRVTIRQNIFGMAMENKILKVLGYWTIGLILIVATVIIIRWATDFLDWARLESGDLGTWVGGIGTVGALIGTIHLARTETRRREHEGLVVARLQIASMMLRFVHAQAVVAEVCRLLDETALVDTGPLFASHAREKIDGIELWTVKELIPLAGLPENTALKLAEAADQLIAFRKMLIKTVDEGNIYQSTMRKILARNFHSNLSETFRLIDQSVTVCKAEVEASRLSVQTV
jgi:uncharacterized membrane protein YjfL (UPF0719 family)